MAKKIICALLCFCLLFCAACGKDSADGDKTSSADAGSKVVSAASSKEENKAPSGPHPTTEAQWVAVPFTSQKQLDAGLKGGEGCQWPTYITFDHIDGSLAFLCIDVGGMYRSTDGGKNWTPSTIGISASGSAGAEIDPTTNKRVLCVGGDSGVQKHHGLYLSTDGGENWKSVLPLQVHGYRDFRHQISFDKKSYDKSKGYCTDVYYLCEDVKEGNVRVLPTLYKSTDGGETWKEVNQNDSLSNGILYVNPKNGAVYVANDNGVQRSTDGGKSFKTVLDKVCYGMCVVDSKPDNVYVSAKDGFYVSTNGGDSFEKKNEAGYPTVRPSRVNVSPANPDNMILQDDHMSASGSYDNVNYFSNDGGKTWARSTTDASMSIMPYNPRQTVFAWHPKDANVCISTGGDMVMRTTNAGKTFVWSGSGYNGSCTTGIFINVNNNDLVFCSNQDYDGAYTTNGGKTWTYTNFSKNGWGGYTYGGYPVTKDIVVAAARLDDGHHIIRTADGGKTFQRTDIIVNGEKRGCGMVGKENIVFLGEYRSDDYGETWKKMEGCTGVYTCSKAGVLYGRNGSLEIVESTDSGITWNKLRLAEGISDIKYDEFNKQLLILSGGKISKYNEKTQKMEQYAAIGYSCKGFDIDPRNGYMYASVSSDAYCNQVGVVRSIDGGKTWVNLSRAPGDGSKGPDGGKKADYVVINCKYNEVWVSCGCRGVWKMACKA